MLAVFGLVCLIEARSDLGERPGRRTKSIPLPKARPVDEPLKTVYLGSMALNMPESWENLYKKTVFYTTRDNLGPKISFSEIPSRTYSDEDWLAGQFALKDEFRPVFEQKPGEITRQDLSDDFGRPAGLIINQKPGWAEMLLLLKETGGHLEFEYAASADTFEDAKEFLVNWVRNF